MYVTKRPTVTLKHLASRLDEIAMEAAVLRAALAVQVDRIIRLEADLRATPYSSPASRRSTESPAIGRRGEVRFVRH